MERQSWNIVNGESNPLYAGTGSGIFAINFALETIHLP
jgi:hypothetical protein